MLFYTSLNFFCRITRQFFTNNFYSSLFLFIRKVSCVIRNLLLPQIIFMCLVITLIKALLKKWVNCWQYKKNPFIINKIDIKEGNAKRKLHLVSCSHIWFGRHHSSTISGLGDWMPRVMLFSFEVLSEQGLCWIICKTLIQYFPYWRFYPVQLTHMWVRDYCLCNCSSTCV